MQSKAYEAYQTGRSFGLRLRRRQRNAKVKVITLKTANGNIQTVTGIINEELDALRCPMKAKLRTDIVADKLFGNIAKYASAPRNGMATVRSEVENDPHEVVIILMDG